MVEYILAIIAALLLFFILTVLPIKLGVKILIKIVFISLMIYVLTNLIHSFYPFYIAIGVFILLLIAFSFVISKEREFSPKMATRSLVQTNEINSFPGAEQLPLAKPNVSTGGEQAFGRLDQASIDALLKAATAENTNEEIDENPETEDVSHKQESLNEEKRDNLLENTPIVDLLDVDKEPEQTLNNIEVEVKDADELNPETELTDEIEDAIEQFLNSEPEEGNVQQHNESDLTPSVPVNESTIEDETFTHTEFELFELDAMENKEELDDIFEGGTRKLSIEEEQHEEVEEKEELVLIDRGLIDEIDGVNENKANKDVEIIRQTENTKKPVEVDIDLPKDSILKKRSKLFEELEKDL